MCKVLMIPGIKEDKVANAWKFAKTIAKPMSRINTDGLGYSAMTRDGKMFGERWLVNDEAFNHKEELVIDTTKELLGAAVEPKETYNNKPITGARYNSYGELEQDKVASITLHTRAATSPRGMENTHPFVDSGVSLIHNGVIRNEDKFELKLSTCDSEAILRTYLDEKVYDDVANAQAALEKLIGYYACGVMSNKNGTPILDIFKSVGARLHAAFVQELETYVISTCNDDIKDTCKELGFTIGQMFQILPNKFIRVNAVTGQTLSITDFTPGAEYKSTNTYSGGQHWNTQNPPTRRTYAPADNTTPALNSKSNVYPWGKKKENTKVSDEMMSYFNSGVPTCVRLSEREVQEDIIMKERHLGGF